MADFDAKEGRDGAQPVLDALARSAFDLNDLGNARRLQAMAGGRLLWIEEESEWVAFDGLRWTAETGKAYAKAYTHKVADSILHEMFALAKASDAELKAVYGQGFDRDMAKLRCGDLRKWAEKTGESAKANAMLEQAKGLRDDRGNGAFLMQADLTDFDADPLAYHCTNGVLRFGKDSAGRWSVRFDKGHRADDMMMQVANVAYDPDAQAVAWTERMAVMHHDPVARDALQRIYGMTLTGLISDQAFYIFQGRGQDGKSTSNDIIGDLHGDYFKSAGPKTFLEGPARGGAEHQSDIVRLQGDIRMVVIDEPKARSTWDGERIKQATGSRFTARGVGAKTEKTFTPRWKLIAECNELPRAPSDDRGFRRRFKLYPWVVQFGVTPGVPDEPVHEVKARLRAEKAGVLNWMIAGTLAWLTEGRIPEPEMSLRANASFWSVSSAMGEFIESCCDISDPAAMTGATELYNAFRDFCLARGDKDDSIMKQTGFGLKLNTLQIYADRHPMSRQKVRMGIRLKADAEAAGGGVSLPLDDEAVPGFDGAGFDPGAGSIFDA